MSNEITEKLNAKDAIADIQNDYIDSEPAPDGGYGWVCVFASFLAHIAIIGVISVFGVYQQAYKEADEFKRKTRS